VNALPDAFEARLVHLGLAREATDREELERDGWAIVGEPDPRYGSTWAIRPVSDEEKPR
jgi:hypothetical protein